MDEQSVITSVTQPNIYPSHAFSVGPGRPPPASLLEYHVDTIDAAAWTARLDTAARLGFDGLLLEPPFATDATSHKCNIRDHARLHERLGGGSADDALQALAGRAHAQDLAVVLDICIDRIAPDALLTTTHPDWFVHAEEGAAFSFLADAEVDWWDARIAAWQMLGIDGFRCEAAHRVPAHVWTRLIAAAKERDATCSFLAVAFGATPDAMAALRDCGFDHGFSSSCWWDGAAPWLADDLDRVSALGLIATLAAPPGGAANVSERAISLAAFVGSLWVMNAAIAAPQDELVAALNTLRRRMRGLFQRRVALVSPPGAPVAAFARIDRAEGGLVLVLAAADGEIAEASLRAWLGDACGDIAPSPAMRRAGYFTADGHGALVLHLLPPRPVVRPPIRSVPAKTAVKAPRIAIEAVTPAVDSGRFAVKRIVGDVVAVEADLICDGHGKLAADLLWRAADETAWQRAPMKLLTNDRWGAALQLTRLGRHQVSIEAWIDHYGAFVDEITKKHAAGVPIGLELIEGTRLVERAGTVEDEADRGAVASLLALIGETPEAGRLGVLTDPASIALMRQAAHRDAKLQLDPPLPVDAERTRAGFASWYEIFPRSASGSEHRHGNFDDVIGQLPRIRDMGFDVLYFPPIHPIGAKNRKGRNNSLTPSETDPGSPYAIGSAEGGHCAIHAALGDFDDFRRLLAAAADHGLEIALDFAIQCAPDHPWLREHPEWFDWRPDGSIRYAENPPKKYEDIVNVDFYAEAAMPSLWVALRDIVAFWVKQGIRIFRVDNPHTKPLPFWEWMIGDIRGRYPDVMFLAEAFTKPKLMYRLAKLGFNQSYTYFTWRNSVAELRDYVTELTTTAPREFFRPHFFVNTPDINPAFLQSSGRPGFLLRAALAATLSGLWGVYNGFELCEAAALPGREEYLDSEKYQLRAWDHHRPGNIIAEITALNRIRRQNPALHGHLGIRFLPCSNERILYFEKADADRSNVVLVAISLDPFQVQTGEIELPLWTFGLDDGAALDAYDLARDFAFVWHGKRQTVSLDPQELPYCIWRVRA